LVASVSSVATIAIAVVGWVVAAVAIGRAVLISSVSVSSVATIAIAVVGWVVAAVVVVSTSVWAICVIIRAESIWICL